MREEQRTQENAISKEQKNKVSQKLMETEWKRWRMKEKPSSYGRIFVVTFSDY